MSDNNTLLYSAHSLMGKGGVMGATAKMQIVHAVQPFPPRSGGDNFNTSLCGKKPAGRSLGWHEMSSKEINCSKCLEQLNK